MPLYTGHPRFQIHSPTVPSGEMTPVAQGRHVGAGVHSVDRHSRRLHQCFSNAKPSATPLIFLCCFSNFSCPPPPQHFSQLTFHKQVLVRFILMCSFVCVCVCKQFENDFSALCTPRERQGSPMWFNPLSGEQQRHGIQNVSDPTRTYSELARPQMNQ